MATLQDLEREVAGLRTEIHKLCGDSSTANAVPTEENMAKKHPGTPIHTSGSAKPVPHGGDKEGVGSHKPSAGTQFIGTVPRDADNFDPASGHLIGDNKY